MSHPGGPRSFAAVCCVLLGATLFAFVGCSGDSRTTAIVAGAQALPTPTAKTYPPMSWMARLDPAVIGDAVPIACFDTNRDLHLDGGDSPDLAGLDIALVDNDGCLPPRLRREWFVAEPLSDACAPGAPPPLLVVAIGGGGTDLLDANEGVSAGLIDIVNGIRESAAGESVPTGVILTTAAIKAADMPQRRMEQWLAHDLQRRLEASPCIRVVLIGHSHGAVVITTVLASLEDAFAARTYGVLLDRSLLYYDRAAAEFPSRAALLNVFQTNEGWHGEPIASPNVTNIDMSGESAPREPREAPEPIVAVAHSTLDDSAAVQDAVVERVRSWLAAR